MRVLIAGTGVFCSRLVDRLSREKHDVYVITGKAIKGKTRVETKGVTYSFDLTDDKLEFVVSSIKPEVILFLGSMNENYRWEDAQKTSMDFMAGLTNLLLLASANEVGKFIYVSTTEVYGESYPRLADEDLPKQPANIKALHLSQGEQICREFGPLMGTRVTILRFDEIYGFGGDNDPFSEMFSLAILGGADEFDPSCDKIFSPIFFSDAVDAIFKATESENIGIFNVCGHEVTMSVVHDKIQAIAAGRIPPEGELPSEAESVSMVTASADAACFVEAYGFRILVNLNAGLERLFKTLGNKSAAIFNDADEEPKKPSVFRAILPFFENLLVFTVFVALQLAVSGNAVLSNIDFMMLFVVIIAVTFGLFQATLSILLASAFILWQNMGVGGSIFSLIVDTETVLRLLLLFIIGVLCGHMKNQMRHTIFEKNLTLSDVQQELDTIHEINDTNTRIKHILNNRLVNYENSLAKIYAVTDRLNSLQPDEIFFSAVHVVSDLMNSKDVCVYLVTDTRMCRLMAKSPRSPRTLRKSIQLQEFGVLADSIDRDEIFVNHDLDSELPMMAAPIFFNRQLVSVVMLWDVDFENLTSYHLNRFLIVSRLISDNMGKAYTYTQNISSSMYVENTGILRVEAFNEILKVHMEASRAGETDYHIIALVEGPSNEQIAAKVKPLLRTTDYLGQDEDNKLYILLTNTNENDAKFVRSRLEKAEVAFYA